MKKIYLQLLFFTGFLLPCLVNAQTYTITSASGANPPGGYVTSDLNTVGTVILGSSTMSVNQWSAVQTLPFSFNFYGSPVTQYKVSANGVLTFDVGTSILPGANTTIPTATLPDKSIAFMWDDFTASPPTASGDVCRVNTYGTAPNRQQWIWFYSYEIGNPAYSFAYWALVLEEGTNNIYIVDQYSVAGTSGTTVGVQLNSTTGVMDALSPNIIHPGHGSGLTDNDLWTLVYTTPCVAPPTAGNATVSNATPCFGQNVDLDLSGNSIGTGQTYQWERSSSLSGPWTPEGTSSSTTDLTVTPPSGITYYRAEVSCGASTVPSQAVAVTVAPAFPGGTYTIDSSTATNITSGGTNFRNFTDAMAAISCGISGPVVFNLTGGYHLYNEQINIPATVGSNATNTITINGSSINNTDTLRFGGSASNFATLNIDGADYITINNLVIDATGTTNSIALHLMNGADNNSFNNCSFLANMGGTATTSGCVNMSGSTTSYSTAGNNGNNNTFNGCSTRGGYFGFVLYGSSPSSGNVNNSIINCNIREYYTYGAYIVQQSNAAISGNTFERPTRTSVSSGYGVYLSTGCSNMLAEKNRIFNLFGGSPTSTSLSYAIYCSAAAAAGSENKIYNNLVYNLGGSGTHAGLYLTGATYIQAYHNTIALNDVSSTAGTTYGIYATGTSGVDIENNNISITRTGSGTKYCLYFTGVGKTSDHNNLYINAPAGTNYVGYYSTGTAYASTLSDWQLVNGGIWDQNSKTADPAFVNPSTGDYTPSTYQLDNTGAPVGVMSDILGTTRSAVTPDIGAYEFSVPFCFGTPIAGTASSNVPGVCAGSTVALTLSGYSTGNGIEIQWEESPAGLGNWQPILGATTATISTTVNAAMDYHAKVTCTNGGAYDVTPDITVTLNPFYLCYCSPLTGNPLHTTTGNYITNVNIPTTPLNVSTSAIGAGGYTQNYPLTATNTASLTQGLSYTLNATIASASYWTELWIDWDKNGSFDPAEYILLPQGTSISSTITVPATATPGLTGMRLRNSVTTAFGSGGACVSATTGRETEDYVITINPAIQCSGMPSSPGMVSANDSSVCNGTGVNLALTGYPSEVSIAYQWQESPAGQGNFQAISGANGYTYTTGALSADIDYRVAVICTNTNDTAYTNILTITVNNPQLLNTTGATRCGVGTVVLSATPSLGSAVNWYATATGGVPLASNTNTFTTPILSANTTYYAAAGNGSQTQTSAMPATLPNVSTTTYAGIILDASQNLILNSVNVFSINGGSVTVELRNSSGTIIAGPTTFPLVASTYTNPQTLQLNYAIPTGTGYRLLATPSAALAYQGGTFPLPLGNGAGEIVNGAVGSGTSTSTLNYYFYNLQTTIGCEGTRVPVTASIIAAPAYTVSASPDTVCFGSSSTVSISSANAYTYTWTPTGSGSSFTVTPTIATKYYVSGVDANNCGIYDSVTVGVRSVPATVATLSSTSSVCVSGNADLSLDPAPMSGIGIQWQRNTGSGFVDIPGATGSTFSDPVTSNVSYQAKLSCDNTLVTTSTPVAVTYVNPSVAATFPGSRCDAGSVTLVALPSAGATINWYAASTGGSSLGTGNAYTTPSISANTTYYASAVTAGGSTGASPIQITEMDLAATDQLEIQNVSGSAVNVTGWKVYVSDDYTIMTDVNTTAQTLSGTLNPGDILWWSDATGSNYWGSNLFWNPGSNGWVAIVDNNGILRDVVFINWPAASIQSASVQLGATTYALGSLWTGDGITASPAATQSVSRQGTLDNNTSADFTIQTTSMNVTNPGMTLPFSGFGCESVRVPVLASINGVSSGTGLSTGGTTQNITQADGTTVDYMDGCNDKVVSVTDAAGGNTLGSTYAAVLTLPTVQTTGTIPYVPRVFDITPSSDGPATITLYALQSEFNAYNSYVTSNSLSLPLLPTSGSDVAGMNNIVVTQYHGQASAGTAGPLGLYSNANVELIANSAITKTFTGSYWVLTFPATGFSGFFIHTGNSPLAIRLESITAINVGSRNRIDWITSSEEQGDYFELERSTDGKSYSRLASINTKGQSSTYSYWDEAPVMGINYYRLKMLNVSGQFSYSRVVKAMVKDGNAFSVAAYPNPATDQLTIKVHGLQGSNPSVIITDATGKLIRTLTLSGNEITTNINDLAQGMYLIKYTDDSHSQIIKVNKQ